MRSFALLLATSLAFLALATNGAARPQTTNPMGYLTIRITITNTGVTMVPKSGQRGVTAIFLVANHATTSRVYSLGDVSLTHHRGTGFAVKLAQNQQKRVLVYLDERGKLRSAVGQAGKTKVVGVFRIN